VIIAAAFLSLILILHKLRLQRIILVAHDVDLGGDKVILGLDILEVIKIGIVLVRPLMTNLLVCQDFFVKGMMPTLLHKYMFNTPDGRLFTSSLVKTGR
jgi:hypothetical protein